MSFSSIDQLVATTAQPSQRHYLTPGRHLQVIGSQDGSFPPFGHHVPDEMGGVWMHPIKLLDGYWLGLVNDDGAVDWLTNATTFGNHAFFTSMTFARDGITVERKEFTAAEVAGLIVEFTFTAGAAPVKLDAVVAVQSDLQPVWDSERAGIGHGPDEGRVEGHDVVVCDGEQDWSVACRLDGADLPPQLGGEAGNPTPGSGVRAHWVLTVDLAAHESRMVRLKVAGSLTSPEESLARLDLLADPALVFAATRQRYVDVLNQTEVELPDPALQELFAWSKCHLEWLTIDSEPIGQGLAAGIPEYVWWFSVDSAYALKGALPAGRHSLATSTLEILWEGSERANGNGRIIHEENSFGVVGNPGNTQETALFVHAIYEVLRWTGDAMWLQRMWPAITAALHYLQHEAVAEGALFPVGPGVMEGCGLSGELIDTAVYTQVALSDAADLATFLGEDEAAEEYRSAAERMADQITTQMWLPDEGLFADLRTTVDDLATVMEFTRKRFDREGHREASVKYAQLGAELQQASVAPSERVAHCFQNWVMVTPFEMGLATPEQAAAALPRLNSPEFVGEWGAYLGGHDDPRIMTISTAVLIQANLSYGAVDEAVQLIHRVQRTLGQYLPGSVSEMSPDYGCFVQAWTAYATITPLVCGILGVQPDALHRRVHFAPQLPTGWDWFRVRHLRLGEIQTDVSLTRDEHGQIIVEVAGAPGWEVTVAAGVELSRP